MKQMFTYLAMATIAITMFTSCDRDWLDREEARTLDGTWTGYIDNYYYDRWGLSGDTYRTAMYFDRSNTYGGYGYEVDYDARDRYNSWFCEFKWEVAHGCIHIMYYDKDYSDIYINDYQLDDYHFSGYMDDGYCDSETYFSLSYESYFDWGYWTRGITRGTAGDGEYHSQASSIFAKKNTKEASE